ncbi:galactose-1-epimerase [Saccharobesus litoralis]|uniref:Aldose 1-epimerase n=1 Tax=Saccharobesus litoralis TaxID=2172099 RepID=A0A2S0VVG0_9ALTE|nr:aldose epimerase family protein [Saccharobesus litoralis]AWB68163.1 galactose-1-epimerase [Saccharobesus litoralis]
MSELKQITLKNNQGMQVELLNVGARVRSIKFPVNGQPTEMTVAYQNVENYQDDVFYLGATCGRVCNRIANGKFELNGQSYDLPINNGPNCLHGGELNFSYRFWQIEQASLTDTFVKFDLVSEEGDQGFPGQVTSSVIYQLTEQNELKINYLATTTAPTPINMTNHCYFDLGEGSCRELSLQMAASSYLPLDEHCIPTGETRAVEQGEFSFRQPAVIGERIDNAKDEQLVAAGGYDHCLILDNSPMSEAKATLTSHKNNIKLELFTDQPSVQLYSGRYLGGELTGFQGVCLEAQNYPDAINQAHFPNSVLQVGEEYYRNIVFKFSAL